MFKLNDSMMAYLYYILVLPVIIKGTFAQIDCTTVTDGMYEHETGCSNKYYRCSSGVRGLQTCSTGDYFHQPTGVCINDRKSVLSCKCQDEGGKTVYVGSANSCLKKEDDAMRHWELSYEQCEIDAKSWYSSDPTQITGRLLHITDDDLAEAARDVPEDLNKVHYIGMKADPTLPGTSKNDYRWWLTRNNENAITPVNDWSATLSYVNDEQLNDANKDCATTRNQEWLDRNCAQNFKRICQYFYDRCAVDNPCTAPTVCVPDTPWQTHCYCPSGTPEGADCGADCSSKPDGSYPLIDTECSSPGGYKCMSGAVFGHGNCPGINVWTGSCQLPSLKCRCIELGGEYVDTEQVCVKASGALTTWQDAYGECQNRAKQFGLTGLIGRLVLVTSDAMDLAVKNQSGDGTATNVKFWLGLANEKYLFDNSISDFRWWLDGKNENAVQTASLTGIHTSDFDSADDRCGFYIEEKWGDALCDELHGSICEILYDACNATACPYPKECIVDKDGEAQCFCPSGLPQDAQCGANCTGKSDGMHKIVNCSSFFVGCFGGNIVTYTQCPTGNVYENGTCVDQNELFDCKCGSLGGVFAYSTESCIILDAMALNMHDSYTKCQDKASTDFGTGYAGRLVHVTNDEIATTVYHQGGYSPTFKNWIGSKMGPNGYDGGGNVLDHYRWWLDLGNENSVYPITKTDDDLVDVIGAIFSDPANEYCVYTRARKWHDIPCSNTPVTSRAMCEIIINNCTGTTCIAPKTCVPDVNRETHCFCQNGTTPCGSYCANQCQNGGSCIHENVTSYSCNCTDEYLGMNCEYYCNTTDPLLPWSTCSRNCDYGIQHRPLANFIDRNEPLPDECNMNQFQFQSCQTQSCEVYTSTEYSECTTKNGFYTKNACYFVIESNITISWSDARIKCQQQDSVLAIIADTNEALDAIYGYLLSKAPDVPVWISHKALDEGSGIFPMSMVDESESLGFTTINHTGASGCFAIGHIQQNTGANGKMMESFNCSGQSLEMPSVKNALCMKRTPYADFVVNEGKKIKMLDGLISESGMESSAWMCGLRCRRSKLCLAHAFKNTTGECQLYKVKEGLPMTITSGSNMKMIYMVEDNTEWVLYNRLY